MSAKVIVADDHLVVRQGVKEIVTRLPQLSVVAEATNGIEAENFVRTIPADLLILDISMPEQGGIVVLESLRKDGIQLPVLFFSMHPAEQYADYLRRAGAQGFVSKSASGEELNDAIVQILGGGSHFPGTSNIRQASSRPDDPFSALSEREMAVMQGIIRGISLQQIAVNLNIKRNSVTTYRRRLLDKLKVESNVELASLAKQYGYDL